MPFPPFNQAFEVSSDGRVRRIIQTRSHVPREIAGYVLLKTGYRQFLLSHNKVKRKFCGHELVAAAFIGKRPLGYDINHKDFNRLNNRADNLEYVTRQANVNYSAQHGRHRWPNRRDAAIKLYLRHPYSESELASLFGVHIRTVRRWINWRKAHGT